jgi:putative monooxygenase
MTEPHRIVSAADVPGDARHGAAIKALLSPRSVGATTGFMGVGTIRPGEVIREHYHPHSEEFTYLVSGRLVATVDGVPRELVAGEAMMVPIDLRHRLQNDGDEDAFIVFSLSPLAPRPDLGHVSTEEAPPQQGG